VANLSRLDQLRKIHLQLEVWQTSLASRVAGEARALDTEIDRLEEHELDVVTESLRQAYDRILASCDQVRDLRRSLQERPPGP
jgi:hypothetical protein